MRTPYGFSLAIILLMIGPAWADKAPVLPQPDPEGYWRLVTHDDATTTIQCIGDHPIRSARSNRIYWPGREATPNSSTKLSARKFRLEKRFQAPGSMNLRNIALSPLETI